MIHGAVAMFERTRPAGWGTLLLFCAATATFVTGSVLVFEAGLLRPAVEATRGLVDEALLCSAVALAAITGGILLGIGRLRAKDIGVRAAKLAPALAVTLTLWALAQLAGLTVHLFRTGTVALHHDWADNHATYLVGALMGQLFGNALFEETAYRGFLLPQLYLKLGVGRAGSPKARLVAALAISQSFFALMHVPIRLHQGTAPDALPTNLLATIFVGLFFCWIYLQTGNLFIAVGVHALINQPTPLLESALPPQLLLFILVVLMLVAWPLLARLRRRSRPTTGAGGIDGGRDQGIKELRNSAGEGQ